MPWRRARWRNSRSSGGTIPRSASATSSKSDSSTRKAWSPLSRRIHRARPGCRLPTVAVAAGSRRACREGRRLVAARPGGSTHGRFERQARKRGRVRFLVLGPLEILDGERPVPLGSAKQRLLLAALLVHANTVVSVDRLADLLWGDEPPADAAGTLQSYVSRLRAVLEPQRAGGGPGRVLVTQPPLSAARRRRGAGPDPLRASRSRGPCGAIRRGFGGGGETVGRGVGAVARSGAGGFCLRTVRPS